MIRLYTGLSNYKLTKTENRTHTEDKPEKEKFHNRGRALLAPSGALIAIPTY